MTDRAHIGIVTILPEEARAVQEWLECHDKDARNRGPANRYFYSAEVPVGSQTVNIVTTQAFEQGAVSAVLAHQYLAHHFQPSFTVLLGIAGGIHESVSLGDVVIAQQVIDYGPAATTAAGVRHRGSAFRAPANVVAALNDYFSQGGDPRVIRAHDQAADLGRPSFSLQRGPIGTGPRVIKFHDAEERKFLESFNEKTLALETEAESVARTYYEAGEGGQLGGYMVLRAISDHADQAKDDGWKLAASRNAVLALEAMLPTLVEFLG